MTKLQRLSVVTEAFAVTGRGTVVVIEAPGGDNWRLKNGQSIVLKLPGGLVIHCIIIAVEIVDPAGLLAIVIGNELKPESVPAGTQIWIEA